MSMISVLLFWNQGLLTSLLAYKVQYLMLGGIALLVIAPTQREVIKALEIFTILVSGVYLIRISNPNLFILKDGIYDYHATDISIPGGALTVLLLYYYLQNYKYTLKTGWLLKSGLILGLLICMQNRSSLFPAILCCLYVFMSIKSRYKPFILAFLTIIIVFIAIQTLDIWNNLYDQTIKEINNPKYNRNLALTYFLHNGSNNIFTILFGNGIISAHTSSIVEDLKNVGIYNADMGFIGYWNEFGVFPIIVYFTLIYNTLRKSYYPTYLKLFSVQILACSLTIMYFGSSVYMLNFLFYYYLYELYKTKHRMVTKRINVY